MNTDDLFKNLLLKKDVIEPSEDLVKRIINNLHQSFRYRTVSRHYLILSWLFFSLGLVTGILICVFSDKINLIYGIGVNMQLKVQLVLCLVILLLFERIFKSTIELKRI
jgi:cytochrome c oxidase subunit IV